VDLVAREGMPGLHYLQINYFPLSIRIRLRLAVPEGVLHLVMERDLKVIYTSWRKGKSRAWREFELMMPYGVYGWKVYVAKKSRKRKPFLDVV
jgi:hypothetical protein